MSGEIIALAAVGVALSGLILTSSRGLRQAMTRMGSRLKGKISGLESHISELRERRAHLEGLLEGLREAITGRAVAG